MCLAHPLAVYCSCVVAVGGIDVTYLLFVKLLHMLVVGLECLRGCVEWRALLVDCVDN